jgi:hypothetical protein
MSESREEKVIGIAAKLYEFRAFMRSFHGDRYAEEVEFFKRVIQEKAKEFGGDQMKAMAALAIKAPSEGSFIVPMFAAAYVELVEAKP